MLDRRNLGGQRNAELDSPRSNALRGFILSMMITGLHAHVNCAKSQVNVQKSTAENLLLLWVLQLGVVSTVHAFEGQAGEERKRTAVGSRRRGTLGATRIVPPRPPAYVAVERVFQHLQAILAKLDIAPLNSITLFKTA